MRGILIVIGVIAVFGYMWHADMLPFYSQNTSTALSPTVENIQQVSNVIPTNKHKTVYYSFDDVPSIPDKQIPLNALKKAIQTWEVNKSEFRIYSI